MRRITLVMAAVLLSGAVATLTALTPSPAAVSSFASHRTAEWRYTSRATGIPVSDSNGAAMYAPFLGGFDVPRPQLVDINGDGNPRSVRAGAFG